MWHADLCDGDVGCEGERVVAEEIDAEAEGAAVSGVDDADGVGEAESVLGGGGAKEQERAAGAAEDGDADAGVDHESASSRGNDVLFGGS